MTGVARFKLDQFFGARLDQVGELQKEPSTLRGVRSPPTGLRLRRRRDGGVDIFRARFRNLADLRIVEGIEDRDPAARQRVDKLAVDEKLCLHGAFFPFAGVCEAYRPEDGAIFRSIVFSALGVTDQNLTATFGALPSRIRSGTFGEPFSQTSSIARLAENP